MVKPETLDFLYLDSYDLTETIDSPTHHLAELASVYPRLPSGCLIAVDDCVSEQHGKHRFVRDWLEDGRAACTAGLRHGLAQALTR